MRCELRAPFHKKLPFPQGQAVAFAGWRVLLACAPKDGAGAVRSAGGLSSLLRRSRSHDWRSNEEFP